MSMVGIVHVQMRVSHGLVSVPVSVGNVCQLFRRMFVRVMLVMRVFVSVLERRVLVEMFVPIGQEQECTGGHGDERGDTPSGHGLAQNDPR